MKSALRSETKFGQLCKPTLRSTIIEKGEEKKVLTSVRAPAPFLQTYQQACLDILDWLASGAPADPTVCAKASSVFPMAAMAGIWDVTMGVWRSRHPSKAEALDKALLQGRMALLWPVPLPKIGSS